MKISDLTTTEAIAVHHALDMLRIATHADFPMEAKTKLGLLKNLVTPQVVSAIAKLESHLDSLRQVQVASAEPGDSREHVELGEKGDT